MTNEKENIHTEFNEISMKEIIVKIKGWWFYLWSKKWIIVIVGIIGGLFGFWYAYSDKPIYSASTTFVLESGEKSGGLGAYAGVASMMGIDLGSSGGGIFQGDNIIELYKSRTMIEKTLFKPLDVSSKKTLIEAYIEINKWREGWKEKPELNRLRFTNYISDRQSLEPKQQRLRDSLIGKIVEGIKKNNLNVAKPDKKLNIFKVEVKSINETFAKRFNEELVDNVNNFYIQTKTKKSLENVAILQHKTDSVRSVMNGAIYSAVAVTDATPNLNPTRQIQRIAPVQRAQFSAETNKAILSGLVQNLEASKMALLKETPLIQVLDQPVFPLSVTKKGKLMSMITFGILFGVFAVTYFLMALFFRYIKSL